jgi:type IV pilus assembly protein PilC
MTYVVPVLLGTLQESGRELPALTQAVKFASDMLVHWWWAILVGLVGLAVGLRTAARTDRGRAALDWLLLKTPVLGELIRKENTSRIAVVLAVLLRSGLNFTDAVRITRRTIRNSLFKRAMADYEQAVTAGSDVAAPLKASGIFSPMVVQMLAVGQQSGELEEMLEQLATTYDEEVRVATERFTAVLEPLLIVMLAAVVGMIALATILPIMEASNVL